MTASSFAANHLLESLHGALAEAAGNEELARCLNARTRLRLMTMSDDDVWELARLIASPADKPVEVSYSEIKQAIEEHKATAHQWIADLSTSIALASNAE